MKKSILFFFAVILLGLQVGCNGDDTAPESLREEDKVATIVPGTLSAVPPSISAPTMVATIQPTSSPTASQAPSLRLEDFPNKVLLGEDESYSVYLINSSSGDAPEKTGEVIIYDKGNNLVYPIIGSFTFFGTTIVSNDGKGEYILLSHGSYTSRKAIVIALNDKKQAVNDFCTSRGEFGAYFFWNDYVVFNNCDTFTNRPWGAGEAPSIAAINLKTGLITEIAKSDLTHHFHVQAITGNSLQYLETSVEKEEDWQSQDSQNTVMQTYDLLSLGSGN
jgi:hypothetical protein